jgi:hypothetical protein
MPDAVSYRVDLARDEEFQQLVDVSQDIPTTSWSTAAGVGRYFARVRAIDRNGVVGEPSSPRRLAVIPCILPPGSTADIAAGTLVVPEGRAISFGDPSGLDLALDKGGFSRAPTALLVDGAPFHDLRFRLREDTSSVSTVYVAHRRTLRADIQITPRLARWPSDPIDVTVTLDDPSGRIDPAKIDAQLQILIGLREISPPWSRRGPVWSTRVQPLSTGGPTVIRVLASDEHGTPIGRNFLEVDYKPPVLAVETSDGASRSRVARP